MRLENKMHKWFKFILKSFPFWFLFLSMFNILFNETTSFNIETIISNSIGTNNYFVNAIKQMTNIFGVDNNFNEYINRLILIVFDISATQVETSLIYNLFYFVFSSFIWFIIVDLIDLVYSAFRFIIDIFRSWLESFYEKNKGGYK